MKQLPAVHLVRKGAGRDLDVVDFHAGRSDEVIEWSDLERAPICGHIDVDREAVELVLHPCSQRRSIHARRQD